MGCLWLVSCVPADYGYVLHEIRCRDGQASVLRFPALEMLGSADRGVVGRDTGVAICDRDQGIEELERTIGLLCSRVGHILLFTDSLDAGRIARLFQAGATEVIAMDRGTGQNLTMDDGGRAEVGCCGPGSPAADDGGAVFVRRDEEAVAWAVRDTAEIPPWVEANAGAQGMTREGGAGGKVAPLARVASKAMRDVCPEGPSHGAPVICALSGRGGVGKSVLVAAMACASARMGLRVAILDFDLMFGNLYRMFGVERPPDLGRVSLDERGDVREADVEATALRIGPGLTLWGPLAVPERAELMGRTCERLIAKLKDAADVVLVDSSVFWSDAVGAAVGMSDRCLLVGSASCPEAESTACVCGLAQRLGVPKTRMSSVVMRMKPKGASEERALRFEMGVGLRSKMRVPAGGHEVAEMLEFGKVRDLMEGSSSFAESVSDMTGRMLSELGCPVAWEAAEGGGVEERPRLRLPWKQERGDA